MRQSRFALPVLLVGALLLPRSLAAQAQPAGPSSAAPQLTRDQMRVFMLKARVIKSRDIGTGVTHPIRLTLTDGTLTHDAAFQSVDESKLVAKLSGSRGGPGSELNFVDAYRYNLAAEGLAGLVGLEHMMPVHVERSWNGRTGSLSWWVDTLMDEGTRLKKGVDPPDRKDWNNQMYRMRVFAALVRDTDRNLGNVLITPEWKVIMIDFTRAFRLQPTLSNLKDLPKCDRALLSKMEELTADSIKQAADKYMTKGEIDAVLKRRDLLVTHFKGLIRDKGEAEVLYE